MALSRSLKHLNLFPSEGEKEAWTKVVKRRRRTPALSPAQDFRLYKTLSHGETSTFHAIRRVGRDYLDLRDRVQGKA